MFIRILIFTSCIALLVSLLGVMPIHGESDVYDNVLRLHVLANSDSESDQALKLKVRDAIVRYTEELLVNVQTQKEAKQRVEEGLGYIEALARQTVVENGFEYDVSVMLGVEEYPTRNYESLAFPGGEYLSLRVLIGEGAGQNWWCVLFPPMCLSAASAGDDAFAQVGLNGEQYNIITESDSPKYKIRFKLLETFGAMFK